MANVLEAVCLLGLVTALGAAGQSTAEPVHDEALHTLTAMLEGKGFVEIPPGEFVMGSANGNPDEQPPHRVTISRGFQIGRFEVTQAQWVAVMRNPHGGPDLQPGMGGSNPSHFKGPAKPVENVSWDDVQQFLQRLNKRDPQHLYRLPTEAEWEYACRAGEAATETSRDLAWHRLNSENQTQPVGRKRPNRWGLHDMLGNVAEWVQDWYAPDYYGVAGATDPEGPASSSYKVYRGCAWLSESKDCRPAFRGFNFPNSASDSVGFRLVRKPR